MPFLTYHSLYHFYLFCIYSQAVIILNVMHKEYYDCGRELFINVEFLFLEFLLRRRKQNYGSVSKL